MAEEIVSSPSSKRTQPHARASDWVDVSDAPNTQPHARASDWVDVSNVPNTQAHVPLGGHNIDAANLSEGNLQHGRQSQFHVEQRNGILDLNALVLLGDGADEEAVDRGVRVLAAVEDQLGVGLDGNGVRHVVSDLSLSLLSTCLARVRLSTFTRFIIIMKSGG